MTIRIPNYVEDVEYELELIGEDRYANIVGVTDGNGNVDYITLETFWRELAIACGSTRSAEQLVDDEAAHAREHS